MNLRCITAIKSCVAVGSPPWDLPVYIKCMYPMAYDESDNSHALPRKYNLILPEEEHPQNVGENPAL